MSLSAFRRCPSSLYTFTKFPWSLARDWHAESSAKRSPTLSRSTTSFRCIAPNLQLGILCSILLSYVDKLVISRRFVPDAGRNINTKIITALET